MGKILCFIYDDMADFEMTLPGTAISWLKKELVTIAYKNKAVQSRPGFKYLPHATVKEALDFDDIDGLIIPGGWGDEQKTELTELIQKLNKGDKMLAAICAGPKFLARAGVLNDKKYTTTLT
ncbi:DJ-1/PfpI family protein [Oceanirhabdus sp. W0125-5]|uniref:DJ-1/PfpI family protein n=1 Tax=Oceanirhabdus sp. W0125-5 TaxID=2999116 RepID=UPI0022F30DBE|nr:DJ-1/PfpI family protein [Oceanirhabdus sp. W0125-5]WBW94921.1 DJ-1/PfpI family protein [Oceanirhabdus sp. W0125-5]